MHRRRLRDYVGCRRPSKSIDQLHHQVDAKEHEDNQTLTILASLRSRNCHVCKNMILALGYDHEPKLFLPRTWVQG